MAPFPKLFLLSLNIIVIFNKQEIFMELKQLKGIGEKTVKTLNRAGIEKVEDLLDYYPRYYDTYEEHVLVRNL